MEYIELIRKFWLSVKEYPLNASAISFYLFLLENWNNKEQKDFELSDNEISRILKINRKTIKVSKDMLRNLGLISYQVTNGYPTFYKIILDYSIRKPNKDIPIAEKNIKKAPQEIPPAIPTIVPLPFPEIETPQDKKETIEVPHVPPKQNSDKPKGNIPTLEEFLAYAKTLDLYEESLIPHLKIKYETWEENNWTNGYGNPIINWKMTLKNTMPYLKNNNKNKNIMNIPKINRPKTTYNE